MRDSHLTGISDSWDKLLEITRHTTFTRGAKV